MDLGSNIIHYNEANTTLIGLSYSPQEEANYIETWNVSSGTLIKKTKVLAEKLKGMGLEDVLVVTEGVDESLYLSARNLKRVDVRDVAGIDPVSLIAYSKVLVTVPALKKVEEMLG